MSAPLSCRTLSRFLGAHRTATLATAGTDGMPHAADVQYAADASRCLYWLSSPAALHSRHLRDRADVAMTVHAPDDAVERLHGVQLRGRVAVLVPASDAYRRAWALYAATFPFVRDRPEFRRLSAAMTLYQFTPTWARWIDNRRGFGFNVVLVRRGETWVSANDTE